MRILPQRGPAKKILIYLPGAEIVRGILLAKDPTLEVDVVADDGEFAAKLATAAIVVAQRFDPAPLRKAPLLEWLHITLAGVDFLAPVKPALLRVVVTNARGVIADHIANYVAGAIVHLRWNFPAMMRNQRDKIWKRWATEPLAGQVACIVGLGAIGQEIAKRVAAMGMTAIGVRASGEAVPGVARVFRPGDLLEGLRLADFVILSLPSTAQTAGLIGAQAFGAMKPEAFLINIARGAVVDEAALVAALAEKRIAGACLDVFAEEPLPVSSPLWSFPNVTITPHSSGVTTDYAERSGAFVAMNLERFRSGQPLVNVVDVATAL